MSREGKPAAKEYKPVVAINLCLKGDGDEMFYIRRGYVEGIMKAGGLPISLPLVADRDYAERVVEFADAVLLPGSLSDVNPRYYGAEITPQCGVLGAEREESDFFLLESAFKKKIPVWGICYGHQSLNVFCGGSLYQDIPHDLKSTVTHWQEAPYHAPAHSVKIEEGSILHRLFGKTEIEVNSVHHQGVKSLGPSLKPSAYSLDGVIEGYENRNGNQFIMGTQWHPERMWQDSPEQLKLFVEFINAARRWHKHNA